MNYEGGLLLPSAAEDFAAWQALDGCQGAPQPSGESCETHLGCDAGVEVTLCSVVGTHVLYDNLQGFSVPDFVWNTFERQLLP
jgi:hypothetical protein